jgi:hypothetical protein
MAQQELLHQFCHWLRCEASIFEFKFALRTPSKPALISKIFFLCEANILRHSNGHLRSALLGVTGFPVSVSYVSLDFL